MLDRLSYDLVDASKRLLELTPLKSRTIKIAITGLSKSGKSVFITSFIDQILNNKDFFSHVKGHKSYIAKLQAPKIGVKRFDYYHYEKSIKQQYKWCESTDSITSALLKIKTKGSIPLIGDEDFYIELVDYPGEWILDLTLLSHTYTSWANQTIKWLESIKDDKVSEFLERIKNLSTQDTSLALETSLHVQYTELILYLKKKHYSFITPGRFLVPSDMQDDPMLVFAPLPKSNSKLYKNFKARYKTYVEEVVKGIHLDYFRGFDRQIILFDILEALQNGYECYKDLTKALDNMFSIYAYAQGNFLSRILSPTIEKVAFVGTKVDLVPSSMHESYLSLLKQICENKKQKLDEMDVKTFLHVVASIKCTQTIASEKNGVKITCLRGIDKNEKLVEVYPGQMPPTFPTKGEWAELSYMYEEFLPPKKEYKINESFEHINVNRLIWDLIGDML